MDRILAIDNGLTVTKAVIFDLEGTQIAVSRRNVPQLQPAPRRVERDMAALWQQTAAAIREVLESSATDPARIVAVAATAHGDGLYLLDRDAAPLGPGILSLDSRAIDIVDDWQRSGTDHKALSLTGQAPHVSAPSALLAWMRREDPDCYARIGHILSCKDWLCYCLSGHIGTDRTEASTSFCDAQSQSYSPDALALFGLADLDGALPDVAHSAEIVGTITADAARATGLTKGTPVAAGLHDVTASALGIGAHQPGVVGIVAGTYSINECVSTAPRIDARWFCRNAVGPGQWNNMAISPASATNYDWFLDSLCAAERQSADASIHARLGPEIDAALSRPSSILYHPYLFGSPMGAAPSAGFLGLRGWHGRGDMLAALLEGIAFNHRQHIDALRDGFGGTEARLTGGASRNPTVAQLFADILDMPVTVTDTDEAAAWGAALCAGAAVGTFARFDADPRDIDRHATVYRPSPDRVAHYTERYAVYREIAETMTSTWDRLNALEAMGRGGRHD
ncbi:FGGY-family carbohydrate kinase [Antarctobacter heliothermus]|uniref:L-xylulokinase n=1 Tax=Antarctobacter heliothermus TaxID=74033 RepID=A0A239CXN5_9RHOB|nr:FGGY-family carbohydrate kinase [Antarctobacter heliothermus]SNS24995.1 L-xylulokinase [Antarctobacter heliothermus]